ncbi:hypothetical protein PHYPSEUDO_012623 [Phytophthora pseudosyringae]|uniref:Uncharacterized protein n=1 Tax=Phytophthora pseudosyringae TaxID=221518 RepID=A0A8T1W4U4_9STRA|nr:hypothetical protein PHYPSEUDO_012623 [Phytophthora pseudosyringae]
MRVASEMQAQKLLDFARATGRLSHAAERVSRPLGFTAFVSSPSWQGQRGSAARLSRSPGRWPPIMGLRTLPLALAASSSRANDRCRTAFVRARALALRVNSVTSAASRVGTKTAAFAVSRGTSVAGCMEPPTLAGVAGAVAGAVAAHIGSNLAGGSYENALAALEGGAPGHANVKRCSSKRGVVWSCPIPSMELLMDEDGPDVKIEEWGTFTSVALQMPAVGSSMWLFTADPWAKSSPVVSS